MKAATDQRPVRTVWPAVRSTTPDRTLLVAAKIDLPAGVALKDAGLLVRGIAAAAVRRSRLAGYFCAYCSSRLLLTCPLPMMVYRRSRPVSSRLVYQGRSAIPHRAQRCVASYSGTGCEHIFCLCVDDSMLR